MSESITYSLYLPQTSQFEEKIEKGFEKGGSDQKLIHLAEGDSSLRLVRLGSFYT